MRVVVAKVTRDHCAALCTCMHATHASQARPLLTSRCIDPLLGSIVTTAELCTQGPEDAPHIAATAAAITAVQHGKVPASAMASA